MNAVNILEIGPGDGNLLLELKDSGFEVAGVEISPLCVKKLRARDVVCHQGRLEDVLDEIGARKFDAIILNHAFEHLYQPVQMLELVYGLLNKGGMVFLVVPNIDSFEAKLFKRYWRGLDLPRHIIHYNSDILRRLLSKSGFSRITIKDHIFPSSFVESIFIYILRGKKMVPLLYYSLLYPWKLLVPIHKRLIGSGILKVVAYKD